MLPRPTGAWLPKQCYVFALFDGLDPQICSLSFDFDGTLIDSAPDLTRSGSYS